MAVKVIDPSPDPDVVKRISCRNCGARLEYVPADIQNRKEYDYAGGVDVVHFIKCPSCHSEVHVRNY